MKRTLTALTVAASLISSGAYAYDDETFKLLENLSDAMGNGFLNGTLKERNEGRNRLRSAQEDWENHPKHNIDLSSANLSGFFLDGLNLSKADLRNVNLEGAYLRDANLILTNLEGANLGRSYLDSANLFSANLEGANLSGASLKDAKLDGVYMNGATLCNTTMPNGLVIYSGC